MLAFKSFIHAKPPFKEDTSSQMATVVCVMLRLLTHALAAALKEGRKSLVMDAIFFHNVATLMNIVFPAASILLCVCWFNVIEQISKEQVVKMKVAKPVTARTYSSVFDYCAGRCCHCSESVVHENAYISDFHHCFSLPSSSSAGKNSTLTEARLSGINVVVGR
ncbi:hypothetical protein D0Y65_033434 [Glycine soja]|nr:hypothetical protein D0Y65_033434 [Glycine soja]